MLFLRPSGQPVHSAANPTLFGAHRSALFLLMLSAGCVSLTAEQQAAVTKVEVTTANPARPDLH